MFTVTYPVRFAHCDAAGIVYYPRYFEMCDAVVEDWTRDVLGIDRRGMHLDRGLALPTVELETGFTAPSRLGDLLDFALTVEKFGRSSVGLTVDVQCAGERRMLMRCTQVLTDLKTFRSVAWPQEMRERLEDAITKDTK